MDSSIPQKGGVREVVPQTEGGPILSESCLANSSFVEAYVIDVD